MILKYSIVAIIYKAPISHFWYVHRVRDEKIMKAFGVHLKNVRLKQGMTQEELANKADIAFSSVARIESGKINTTISTVARIAKTLQVDMKQLMDF